MPSLSSLLSSLFLLSLLLIPLSLFHLTRVISPSRPKPPRNPSSPAHILIVLGSGGHTAEMLAMLERAVLGPSASSNTLLDWNRFSHRTYVVSSGDALSASRARAFEEKVVAATTGRKVNVGKWRVEVVPRAREIHQPLWSAPFSSVKCGIGCVRVLRGVGVSEGEKGGKGWGWPDLMLCNGPATATIMILVAVGLRVVDVGGWMGTEGRMRSVYVESWARVKRLSLSGWLLLRVADRFLVQWPQLQGKGGRAEFIGVLV